MKPKLLTNEIRTKIEIKTAQLNQDWTENHLHNCNINDNIRIIIIFYTPGSVG